MEVDTTSRSLFNTEAATSQSLLNTEYDQLIVGEDANSSDSEDYGLTSYQQPPPQVPLRGKNEAKNKNLKRKSSEVPTTTTAKIKKTEESIKLLRNHLERNTCPKQLKYSARANIPADENLKKKTESRARVLSKP